MNLFLPGVFPQSVSLNKRSHVMETLRQIAPIQWSFNGFGGDDTTLLFRLHLKSTYSVVTIISSNAIWRNNLLLKSILNNHGPLAIDGCVIM